MQKQILYPKFIARLFSANIDLLLITLFLAPISHLIAYPIFLLIHSGYLYEIGANIFDKKAVLAIVSNQEFAAAQLTTGNQFFQLFLMLLAQLTLMGVYFVFFWSKFCTTPGKFIMSMRVVSVDNYQSAPAIKDLIKRYLGYSTIIISFWPMIFNKQGLALHDKLGKTIVIKK